MNAFEFGQSLGEKMANGPLTAEAPMSNPAQAASTNNFLQQPGRNFLNDMARAGRNMQRRFNLAGTAAPMVGSVAGRALGGNLGSTVGSVGGTLLGQQLRHAGGDLAAAMGGQPVEKNIPWGLNTDGRLSNRPNSDLLNFRKSLLETARQLDVR